MNICYYYNIKINRDGGSKAIVYSIFPSGMETIISVKVGAIFLTLVTIGRVEFLPNDICYLEFPSNMYILFDKVQGVNIGTGRIVSIIKNREEG